MAARERINEGVVKRHSPLSSLLALTVGLDRDWDQRITGADMRSLLRGALAIGGFLLAGSISGPASAAGVCNCCNGSVEELCKAACEAANSAGGACRPAAWYGDANAIGGDRPLNGFSFKGLDLSDASRQELEALRRWLEVQRRATEVRARRTERDLKRGKASLDEFKASQTVREEAIINYQHGIQAYIEAARNL